MAAVFQANVRALASDPTGFYFFHLKEHAVAIGWTVKASGDGQEGYGFAGLKSVDSELRGSGGEFDCWTAPPVLDGSPTPGTLVAGAWALLENAGRELLICTSSNAGAGYQGYGRVAYAPKGAGGFGSTGVSPTDPASAATDEVWLYGNRASVDGLPLFTGGAGYLHLFGDDSAELGALPLGAVVFGDDLSPMFSLCVAPVVDGTESPADPDPVAVFYGTEGFASATLWNHALGAMQAFTPQDLAFYRGKGAVDPSGADRVASIPGTIGSGNDIEKGTFSVRAIAWSGSPRAYPDTVSGTLGGAPVRFAYADLGMLFPFPAGVTPHQPEQ